jgi:hypothetical protein
VGSNALSGAHRLAPDRRVTVRRTGIARHDFVTSSPGVFTPVPAKRLKSFSLVDCISIGVDRMERDHELQVRQRGPRQWDRAECAGHNLDVGALDQLWQQDLEFAAPKMFRITEESIAEFKKRYVSLVSIAKAINSRSWALKNFCTRCRLPMLVAKQPNHRSNQAFIPTERKQELLCLRSGGTLKSRSVRVGCEAAVC